MDNPAQSNNPNAVSSSLAPLNGTELEPSYPVFVDPMGVAAGRGPVGDSGQTGIPRVNLQVWDPQTQQMISMSQQMALRFCSLMDSLTFDDGKVPSNPTDMRELRYNFAWALQRPVNRDRYTVRMQVVVFNKRAPLYTPQGSEAVYGNVRFTPGEATIYNVPANTEIRKGTWVMDATLAANKDGDGVTRQLRHAEFYRVVSVTDQGNGTVTLEVHKPIARPDGMINLSATSTYAYQGTLVVMPGVADVFERPNLINSSR
jgi:hypothetical protein